MSYTVHMRTTITVRTDESLRGYLEARATEQGKSLSELVREILERAVNPGPVKGRAGSLRGQLTLDRDDEPWRQRLRERNWRR